MRILALDTATEACSCALLLDQSLLRRDTQLRKGHAEIILSMVDELLREAGTALSMLDAIAFGCGPGSFTGVRLAASVAQGLAFGAGLGVIAVSDLRAVAQGVLGNAAAARVLVCNDARMQEVYWSCFERGADGLMHGVGGEHVGPPERVELPPQWGGAHVGAADALGTAQPLFGAGRGFAAYPDLRSRWLPQLAGLDDARLPSAADMLPLAKAELQAGRLLPPEAALPVYLRDEVAVVKP